MSDVRVYGEQTPYEKIANENTVCRQLVREINDFGVSQRQLLRLIHLLALELENVEHMQAITKLIRGLDESLFLTGQPTSDDEIKGV